MRRGKPPRELQDRQWIAARLFQEPVAEPLVEPSRDDGREKGARVLGREASERELGQPHELALAGRLAHGEHQRHRLCKQPSRDEFEDLPRGDVEPLGIVDEAQQGPLRGDLGQQAERGKGHQEAVRSRT